MGAPPATRGVGTVLPSRMGLPQRGRGVRSREAGSLSAAPSPLPTPQTLLREVQTLRDRLSTDDEASSRATAERLLQVYGQLRSPGLLLV